MDGAKEYTYKCELRKALIAARKNVADRALRERQAVELLTPHIKGDAMVYVSMGSELSTRELISALLLRNDVRLWAPYTSDGVIVPRRLIGLAEPNASGNLDDECYSADKPDRIDMCVTPLLGFNADGYRIGYGKGCYDRFFTDLHTYRIGLAFDLQRVDFAAEKHDVPLDCCVTESGVIYFSHASDFRKV